MMTLTDGKKTVEFSKEEMEFIEEGLAELTDINSYSKARISVIQAIRTKLEGFDY
jgi:hypothetical protein